MASIPVNHKGTQKVYGIFISFKFMELQTPDASDPPDFMDTLRRYVENLVLTRA